MIRLPARPFVFAFVALLGLAACGGDPVSSGTGGGGAAAAGPIAVDVVAAKGGTVANTEKTVTLTIPANSLTADTKVTLTVSAKEEATATSVYTFGPEGVVFETPAALVISTEGLTPPAKMKAVLGTKSKSGWVQAPGATDGSGSVEAPVTSFGAFSVIFVASSLCDASCMSQADAVCCTTCGCSAPVSCKPPCGSGTPWDCEMQCCFDSAALACAP